MKLKLDAAGHAVLQDGLPVYIHDDGKEAPFDAADAMATIKARNGEAKGHRERADAAEAKLKAFEGLEPEKARDALDKISKIDQKKLIDAGEIDKVRNEIKAAFEAQFKPVAEKAEKLEAALNAELIGGAFARSAFIKDKIAIPPDFVQSYFGKHMKVEDGKLVAVDDNGQKIYSRSKPGELATFDEALETLVSSHPHRDSILRGTGNSGAGTRQSNGNGSGKTVTQEAFNAMSPKDRAATMASGATILE